MYDAVRLVADLPYVDKARIGVTGHSHGARAANFSVEIDNQAGQPLIAAVLLVDSNPIYTDGDGQYSNIYKGPARGLIADQYDEFYFRTYNSSGDILTSPRQYIETPISQSFLHFGADPAGITDRRIAGEFYASNHAMRITYTPAETHPWGIISQTTIAFQIGFFQQVFGAPHPIAANSQVWQIMEAFTAIV